MQLKPATGAYRAVRYVYRRSGHAYVSKSQLCQATRRISSSRSARSLRISAALISACGSSLMISLITSRISGSALAYSRAARAVGRASETTDVSVGPSYSTRRHSRTKSSIVRSDSPRSLAHSRILRPLLYSAATAWRFMWRPCFSTASPRWYQWISRFSTGQRHGSFCRWYQWISGFPIGKRQRSNHTWCLR